jgi:hypothetical protein
MSLEAIPVALKRGCAVAHMYDEDLSTILYDFTPADRGFMLPGPRNYLWHTFQRVLTSSKWGWVSVDALDLLGGGEGDE